MPCSPGASRPWSVGCGTATRSPGISSSGTGSKDNTFGSGCLPAYGVPAAAVAATVEADLAAFLARRPAADPSAWQLPTAEERRGCSWAEVRTQAWDRRYGRTGTMPVRDNNSVRRAAYEPEYSRSRARRCAAGRVAFRGVQRHRPAAISSAGLAPRGSRLAVAAQLDSRCVLAFLGDAARVIAFLTRYRDFWERMCLPTTADLHPRYDEAYRGVAERMRRRASRILAALSTHPDEIEGDSAHPSWLGHGRELRERVADLLDSGDLRLPVPGSTAMISIRTTR